MTAEHEQAEPVPGAARPGAAELIAVVESVRGVQGVEAGVGTTLRAIDARLRARDARSARHGLVVQPDGGVLVEVSVDASWTVRSIVEDIQRTLRAAIGDDECVITVRVQSLAP